MNSNWRIRIMGGVVAAVAFAVLAVTLGGGSASADNGPHVAGAGATADSCGACHRLHTAQAPAILKSAQPGLCYTCHGSAAAGADTDVQDGEYDASNTALKAGGFDMARIDTDDATGGTIGALGAGATVTSWHTNDGATSGTLWGNGALGTAGAGPAYTLRCGACHDPHGNGKYRILRPIPTGSGGAGQDVTDEVTKDYDTTNFFDVTYVDNTEISSWCSQCHTRYLAGNDAHDTDSGDAIYTYRHESDGTSGRPACIKCHASHGTNAVTTDSGYSEGVEYPGSGSGTTSDANNSRLLKMDNRGVCQKCHNK